jgi:hypothetical protein
MAWIPFIEYSNRNVRNASLGKVDRVGNRDRRKIPSRERK